jgi:hypothetical protein
VKVIQKHEHSNWAYRYSCKGCFSVLEAEPADVSSTTSGFTGDTLYSVKCALCGVVRYIDADQIPVLMQFAVQAKAEKKP